MKKFIGDKIRIPFINQLILKYRYVLPLLMVVKIITPNFGQSPYVQGVKPPLFHSPNVAALGKFGDIPITYHTGTPEISIPIYTVSQGELSLPISLSYHSSGVKVSDLASWVGLGWSLNAGGMVTRTVHGGPDDGCCYYGAPSNSDLRWSWYYNGGIPAQLLQCQNTSCAGCMGPLQQSWVNGPLGITVPPAAPNSCFNYYWDAARGFIDTEPDLYTFSFNGHSGKFFFDESHKVHMFPEDDYFIQPTFQTQGGKFDGWTIIDSQGVKYFFGTTAATEYTKNDPSGAYVWDDKSISTTWFLYKIVSPNGEDVITLTYADESYSFGNTGGQSFVIDPFNGTYVGSNVTIASSVPSVSVVSGKRLTQITNSAGTQTISFNNTSGYRLDVSGSAVIVNNTSALSLDNIQVSTPTLCKTFTLNHSYSEACPTGSGCGSSYETKRLILNSVQEGDCVGAVLPPHVFTYNSTLLPSRYSLARDKWDYYNGAVLNQGMIPTDALDPISGKSLGNADRAVHESYLQAGILTKITYPTGGSTSFSYEAHRETPTSTTLVGGLRVTQITNDDGFGNVMTKTIQYGNGSLYNGMPQYLMYPQNNNGQTLTTTQFGTIVVSSPATAMWSTQGYHIGYSNVTVSETGNGLTTYSYINAAPLTLPTANVYPMQELEAGFGTSDLIEKDIIRQNETTPFSQESSSKAIGPTWVNIKARKVQLIACSQPANCNNTCDCNGYLLSIGQNVFTDYYVYSNRFYLNSTTQVVDGVSTSRNFEYALGLNTPTAVSLTDSKGNTQRTEWNYPSTSGSGAPPMMYNVTDPNFKNMVAVPTEQREYTNGVLVHKIQNNYTALGSNLLLTQTKDFPIGGSDYVTSNYQYDGSLRLSEISKSDGTKNSFIWGHNNSLMIASAVNADYSVTGIINNFSTTITGNSSTCTNFSGTLLLDRAQIVTLSLTAILTGATGLSVSLTIKNSSGAIVFGPKSYTNGSFSEVVNLLSDTYTLCYQSAGYPTSYTGTSQFNISVPTTSKNIQFTSFEENGVSDSNSKTGTKVWQGTYSVGLPPQVGSYKISFWSRPLAGGNWVYNEQTVNSTTSPTSVVIGQSGYVIDELRVLPTGAMMKTGTYKIGVGLMSSSDENQVTNFYTYDSFGRLLNLKDDKGKLLKTYKYNYKK